jgi:hypothetical protein
VEYTLAIPESNCSMIVRSGASSGNCFNRRVERIGRSSIDSDLGHVDLHIKPKKLQSSEKLVLEQGAI